MSTSDQEYNPLEAVRRMGLPASQCHDYVRLKCQRHISATLRGENKLAFHFDKMSAIVHDLIEGPFFAALLITSGETALEATGATAVPQVCQLRCHSSATGVPAQVPQQCHRCASSGATAVPQVCQSRCHSSARGVSEVPFDIVKLMPQQYRSSPLRLSKAGGTAVPCGVLETIKTISDRLDGPSAEKDINPTQAADLMSSLLIYVFGILQAVMRLFGDRELSKEVALTEPWTGIRHILLPPLRKLLLVNLQEQCGFLAALMLGTHCFMNGPGCAVTEDLTKLLRSNPRFVMAKFARFLPDDRLVDVALMMEFNNSIRPHARPQNGSVTAGPVALDFNYPTSSYDSLGVCDACGSHNHFYHTFQVHCGQRGESKVRLKKCSGCDQRRYCSEECQAVHWKAHKSICKTLRKQTGRAQGAEKAQVTKADEESKSGIT
eukprot:gene20591-27389_t